MLGIYLNGSPRTAARQLVEILTRDNILDEDGNVRQDAVQAGNFGAIRTFGEYATVDQQKRFMDPLLTGEKIITVSMSEPEAGSAVTDLITSATPDGEEAAGAESQRLSFDEFVKVELRVARVVMAEAIPKSKKLLRVTVDDGSGERTLVSGIARAYSPEDLVGRSVVIVANLEKARLMLSLIHI